MLLSDQRVKDMIGIYKDDFLDYLETTLGSKPKQTGSNIICPCPWCEYGETKDHYHLYISLNDPIFHCFHAGCEQKGLLHKLIRKIEGVDNKKINEYVDQDKLKKSTFERKQVTFRDIENSNIKLPPIRPDQFPLKELYLKKRLKFSTNINIYLTPGLIFDFIEFLRINNVIVSESSKIFKLIPYLQENFIGFLTNNKSYIIFRNIDNTSDFRYYKFTVNEKQKFLDYYKLSGNPSGKYVVLAEGIFDIFSEYLFDFTGLKNNTILYACSLSSNYLNLIKSVIFNEQIFKLDLIILSDNNIKPDYYKKLKIFNKSIINSIKLFYNKAGKDFGETPVVLNEFKI